MGTQLNFISFPKGYKIKERYYFKYEKKKNRMKESKEEVRIYSRILFSFQKGYNKINEDGREKKEGKIKKKKTPKENLEIQKKRNSKIRLEKYKELFSFFLNISLLYFKIVSLTFHHLCLISSFFYFFKLH